MGDESFEVRCIWNGEQKLFRQADRLGFCLLAGAS
jgi:hypothetical protein